MYDGFNIWSFLLGLPLGLVVAGIVWFINWRIGKKQRRYDERYRNIHRQARSYSWFATTGAVLIGWMVAMLLEGPGVAFFILTAIWVIHMTSYGVGAAIANSKN
ncbi:hypothetical protein HMPREF9372_3607 [Sporosarcina newyorkensis 2681]|uniref:DUF3796 domain-containing protein n=1 Tax=Sporosarcina newyorkensis 2681 TaxID=1027292 RepID=F9DXS6_9BACL|nr:hypothetical protein [Sporosarcina newyorkensis]EGQ20064.1 hypothetical protein HMPREF9372_3607 [Sporosarcina newyorkensis 2681]